MEKPILTRVWVGNHWQEILYENLHILCFHCGRIGHQKAQCSGWKDESLEAQAEVARSVKDTSANDTSLRQVSHDIGTPGKIIAATTQLNLNPMQLRPNGSSSIRTIEDNIHIESGLNSYGPWTTVLHKKKTISNAQLGFQSRHNKGKASINASSLVTQEIRKNKVNHFNSNGASTSNYWRSLRVADEDSQIQCTTTKNDCVQIEVSNPLPQSIPLPVVSHNPLPSLHKLSHLAKPGSPNSTTINPTVYQEDCMQDDLSSTLKPSSNVVSSPQPYGKSQRNLPFHSGDSTCSNLSTFIKTPSLPTTAPPTCIPSTSSPIIISSTPKPNSNSLTSVIDPLSPSTFEQPECASVHNSAPLKSIPSSPPTSSLELSAQSDLLAKVGDDGRLFKKLNSHQPSSKISRGKHTSLQSGTKKSSTSSLKHSNLSLTIKKSRSRPRVESVQHSHVSGAERSSGVATRNSARYVCAGQARDQCNDNTDKLDGYLESGHVANMERLGTIHAAKVEEGEGADEQ